MQRYFGRKIILYAPTFFLAASIDWMIPRFMPGNPIENMLARVSVASTAGASQALYTYYSHLFGLDVPLWQQYINFWNSLLHGNLGRGVGNPYVIQRNNF